jgi:steroid delta-isomerase
MSTLKRFIAGGGRALASVLLAVTLTVVASAALTPSARGAISPSTMDNLTQDQIEAAVEEYFSSVGSLDVSRFANNFAADGVLEDPVGTPPVQGTSVIAAYFGAIISPFSEIKPKIQEVIVCGHEAAVNWKLNLTTTTGKKITIDGMGIFNFNQDGKLQSVREFWDLAAFLAQLQG